MRITRFVCMAALITVFSAGVTFAQDPDASTEPAPEQGAGVDLSVEDVLRQGGIPLKIIGGLSVFALALVVYLMVVLRPGQVAPRALVQELLTRIQEGELNEARLACSQHPSPLGAVALSALNYLQSAGRPDPVLLKDIMESEGRRQADSVRSPTHYLIDVSAIAPLVGMLGTVIGMLLAFKGIIHQDVKAQPVELAHGVSMALITTIAGLIVAIPTMVFYAGFRGLAMKRVSQLEAASMEVMTALLRGGDSDELS